MRVMSRLFISLNLIGLTSAYVCPPTDGCLWGFSSNTLAIQPGWTITDAMVTVTNVRPSDNCLNPILTIRLLHNLPSEFTCLTDTTQTIRNCFPNAPALCAFWPLNDYKGAQANNLIGGGNPAVFVNNPLWIENEGLSFSDNQYLQIEDSANLCSHSQLAISLWFKIRSPRRYAKLFIKPFETRSEPWELVALDLGADGLTPRFLLSDGIVGGRYAAAYDRSLKIALNQWYHILGTYDGSQMRLWLNGQAVAATQTDLLIGTNQMPICIGGRLGFDAIDGLIREVKIYSGPPAGQSLQWMESSDLFSPYGTLLKTIGQNDLQFEGQSFSFSLQSLDSSDSWIYEKFPRPFSLAIPPRQTPLSFSSAMLELLDLAGRGERWGFGIDTDGFYFDTLTLTLTIEPLDGSQPSTYETLTYRNTRAPVILPRLPLVSEPQQPISLSLSAIDVDGNPSSISVQNPPPGATFDGRTFQWTPTLSQIGPWSVLFTATDGVMSSQRIVLITIKEPTPIFVPLENQTFSELQTLTLPVQAFNLAGQRVPVAVSNLPDGAAFDGNTFEWKPAYGQAGTYIVSFTAANEIRQETISVTLTVLPYKPPAKNKTILIL